MTTALACANFRGGHLHLVSPFFTERTAILSRFEGRELGKRFPTMVTFHPVADADHISVIAKAAAEILTAMNDR